MKKLLVILVLLSACKKKDVEPAPDNNPTTPPVVIDSCKTGLVKFAGKYVRNGDTVIVKFIKNNCPTTNSNTYETTGLDSAVAEYNINHLNLKKITTTSIELADKMQDNGLTFTFFNKQDTAIALLCNKLSNGYITFRKLK